MKDIFKLNEHLSRIHLRRYRKTSFLRDTRALHVTWVSGKDTDSLSHRQSYIFMQRSPSGVSRNVFIFTNPHQKK